MSAALNAAMAGSRSLIVRSFVPRNEIEPFIPWAMRGHTAHYADQGEVRAVYFYVCTNLTNRGFQIAPFQMRGKPPNPFVEGQQLAVTELDTQRHDHRYVDDARFGVEKNEYVGLIGICDYAPDFGYRIAAQFGLRMVTPRAALVTTKIANKPVSLKPRLTGTGEH
jgi:hypothetical protein